jgi:[ribosomal protein S5]-alanine N-acetyltransferase
VPELTTPRLLLHPVTLEEAKTLQAGEALPGWPYAPGYPLPDTLDAVGLFLRHRDPDFGLYLIVRRADKLVIGDGGFVGPPSAGAVSIGYEIVPAARRQGYATETIRAFAAWALGQPGVDEVRAQTLPENEASARALLRAGFVEGEATAKVRRFSLRGD